jgi:tyrosine-protein kinase Fer
LFLFRRTQPTAPITFQFDESLMDDTPKLQPNQLTVDNLTIEWLKQKQLELEGSVKEYQEKQNKMCIENGNGAGNGTPTQNGINGCGKDINK